MTEPELTPASLIEEELKYTETSFLSCIWITLSAGWMAFFLTSWLTDTWSALGAAIVTLVATGVFEWRAHERIRKRGAERMARFLGKIYVQNAAGLLVATDREVLQEVIGERRDLPVEFLMQRLAEARLRLVAEHDEKLTPDDTQATGSDT